MMPAHPLYKQILITVTPVHRVARCPRCEYRVQAPRQGNNALATSAKLRGAIRRHIDTHHTEGTT